MMASSEVIHATPRPRPNTNLNLRNTKNSPSQIPNTFSQGHEEDREGYKQGWNRVRLFVQHSCNTTFSFADSLQQGGVRNVGQNLTECYTVTVSATLNGAFAFVASSSCSTVAFFFFVFSYSTSSFSPLTSSALKVRHRLQHWRECRHQSDWIVDCGLWIEIPFWRRRCQGTLVMITFHSDWLWACSSQYLFEKDILAMIKIIDMFIGLCDVDGCNSASYLQLVAFRW